MLLDDGYHLDAISLHVLDVLMKQRGLLIVSLTCDVLFVVRAEHWWLTGTFLRHHPVAEAFDHSDRVVIILLLLCNVSQMMVIQTYRVTTVRSGRCLLRRQEKLH